MDLHYSKYDRYQLGIYFSDGKYRAQPMKEGKVVTFTAPFSQSGCPKIYVMLKASELLYIGYAESGMAQRLRTGLNTKYGYQWKDEKKLELLVFAFGKLSKESTDRSYKHHIQTIEAELAYLHRCKKKQWPTYQNEIHFRNVAEEEKVRDTAQLIYAQLDSIIHDEEDRLRTEDTYK